MPVAWLNNITAVLVIVAGAVSALFFSSSLKRFDKMLFLFDAMGLGLFAMIGIQKGIEHQLNIGIFIMLGTITGCFGGVLRNVLLDNVAFIFQKEIYASASILGGVIFFLLLKVHLDKNLAYISGIILVFMIRLLAVQFNWCLPRFYERRKVNDK